MWRLRASASRRAHGTPIQIRKTVEARDAHPGAGKRPANQIKLTEGQHRWQL